MASESMSAPPISSMSLNRTFSDSEVRVDQRLVPISSALESLDSWIEGEGFRGWDPHDALNSQIVQGLTLQNRFARMFWLQLLKRSPLNIRPLLGVRKDYNPKGLGLFLASYVRKYVATHDPRDREHIIFIARWLLHNTALGYSGMSWGYNFDWLNRAFFAPAGTPTVVNTAFIGLAFLDLHLLLDNRLKWSCILTDGESDYHRTQESGARPGTALDAARSSCDFILRDLNLLARTSDELCFSYTPLDRRPVHNASMMGACLLASVFKQTSEPHLAGTALAAARFTSRRQLPDGGWPYGENANDRWVDNFHTGFVLVALKRVSDCVGTDEFEKSLLRGYRFWKERMFLEDGTPKYYRDKVYPIDVHSVAQAILTFLEFQKEDNEALERAIRLAQWGIENFQDPQGYFYYWICRGYTIKIPYIRWAQAWMQRALTSLVHGCP